MDLWLIEGLISSPLVFIRGRNGGKAGGFLTAGTAAFRDPVHSDWVRQSGAAAFAHQIWQPWPVAYITALLRAPDSQQFAGVCSVFKSEGLRKLQLFIDLVKSRSG